MFNVVEVLQHWYSGRCQADVGTSLGVDRGTIVNDAHDEPSDDDLAALA